MGGLTVDAGWLMDVVNAIGVCPDGNAVRISNEVVRSIPRCCRRSVAIRYPLD
jgi:hypothetical protein